ncbi:MAG: tRNA uridine-5-carboxymethylaminomethyl(34) synthesis GTPase MnmE [Spirochaetaceae bacterium]|jgi:tRNA modification GTPase|nr:tRNA uridine-5-carboxymethylaminomethyl(34) synthesis GTPase MnmE [Spirochaetaceae bacterium]
MSDQKAQYGDESPIAALAGPPAFCALSLVRLSGKGSLALLAKLFSRPKALLEAQGNTIVYGWILSSDPSKRRLDEVLVSVFRSPHSYTGEESADICCHGGFQTVRVIMEALLASGFRAALPGEFTFRAFLNGKLDLTRAESVMEIVGAKSDAGLNHALERLSGTLETEIKGIKNDIMSSLAETELNLDYSELDGVGDDDNALPGRLFVESALRRLDVLADHYSYEKICRDGVIVVIAGKPNAGKSSLFNLLIKEDRSIVTDIPGTTRDWIEGWISLDGIPIRFIDTAGLRESPDVIEKIGIDRSRALLKSADLVLYMLDGTDFHEEDIPVNEFQDTKRLIFIWNKSDIAPPAPQGDFLGISAKTGEGLKTLCSKITSILGELYGRYEGRQSGIGTDRQKNLIDSARTSLRSVCDMADRGEMLDLIAPLLREALDALGMITGEVSTDDILESMFSRFCVGK